MAATATPASTCTFGITVSHLPKLLQRRRVVAALGQRHAGVAAQHGGVRVDVGRGPELNQRLAVRLLAVVNRAQAVPAG